jgi:hypothetical protein
VSDREIVFLGTSLFASEPEPWVYLEDIESGRVRSIRVHDPALSLMVKDKQLVCVTQQGEIPLRLAEVQLPAIVAN